MGLFVAVVDYKKFIRGNIESKDDRSIIQQLSIKHV